MNTLQSQQVGPGGQEIPRELLKNAFEWESLAGAYECRVLLCPDEEVGGYSAHALRLPGIVGEGETIDEAIENIREAFRHAIDYYAKDAGGVIPWADVEIERTFNCIERWIIVNA